MSEKTHHVSEKKKQIAKNIQKLLLQYPIIAAVNMENLPTPQLQQMRSQLRDKIAITMTKRRVMKHAIEGIKEKKKNIEQLEQHLKGMPALIFTKENPFSLFKTLKKSKTSAPAKAGQTAPFDLKIPKGPTSFAPGPVIGELAQLGIKSGVEGGKVVIKEDSIVVKEGEKISAKAAEILTRLGVEPMEVGLNVTAVYENGEIFTANILDIDEEKFIEDIQKAATWAFNLAIDSAYLTKETISVLIGKAFNDAKALGLSQEIIDEGVIDGLLSKAERSALSLKTTAKVETAEKPKAEEKPKEAPAIEKKEEIKIEEKKEAPKIEEKKAEEPTLVEKQEEKVLEEEKEIVKEEKKLEKEVDRSKIEAPVEKEVEKEVKEEEEKQLEKERIEKEKELEKIEEQKKAEEGRREEERKKQEEEKKKQEEARRKEERKRAEEERRLEEERKRQEEARREGERRKKQEEERKRAKEEAKREEEEEKKKAEEEKRKQEEAKKQKPQDETDKRIAEMVAKTKKFVKGEIPDAEKLVEEAGKPAAKEAKEEVKEEKAKEEKPKEEPKVVELKEAPKVQEKIPSIQELKEKKEKDVEKKKKEQKEVEDLAQELIKKGTLRK